MENKVQEEIKLVWLIHIIWNILSGWLVGTLFVVGYLFLKENIDTKVKNVCYNIINFNLSFIIYFAIWFALVFLLIWFIILPILWIIWLVSIVLWAIKHLAWDDYKYPLSIEFLQIKKEDY